MKTIQANGSPRQAAIPDATAANPVAKLLAAVGSIDARTRRLRKAASYGKICGGCGHKLRDGEPVWRYQKKTAPECSAVGTATLHRSVPSAASTIGRFTNR